MWVCARATPSGQGPRVALLALMHMLKKTRKTMCSLWLLVRGSPKSFRLISSFCAFRSHGLSRCTFPRSALHLTELNRVLLTARQIPGWPWLTGVFNFEFYWLIPKLFASPFYHPRVLPPPSASATPWWYLWWSSMGASWSPEVHGSCWSSLP